MVDPTELEHKMTRETIESARLSLGNRGPSTTTVLGSLHELIVDCTSILKGA